VPGDWNTQHPELLWYEGTVWYRRRIDITEPEAPGTRTFLSVGAANHTTRVFLNGEELALHIGGFGDFAVELTGHLGVGDHSLILMVDNRRELDRIPAMSSDWWNFGGITRSVELITVPATFLRTAWLTMAPDGSIIGGVHVDTTEPGPVDVAVSIAGTDLTAAITADPNTETRFTLATTDQASSIERWQPGAAVLHEVTFATNTAAATDTVVDTITDQVGFRTVQTSGNQVLLNGERVWLKGISLHGEGPTGGKRAHGPDDAATLLHWASELGANFVRLAHYQHDEATVREAERRGLLTWCEVPVYWGIDFGNPDVIENGVQQIDEMVVRDRSRANVILWSVANETMPGPDRHRFLTGLIERVRELDPTRLTTAALLTLPSNDPAVHIDDPLGEHVDVLSINQYMGWYYSDRDAMANTSWTSAFNKPMVFSELGAGAKAGRHGNDDEIWTEEFQAAVYRAQIDMIDRQPDCVGMSPWILKDFRTPMRMLPGVQDGYNRKGVVSEEGQRKLAFDVLADFYRSID